MIRDSAKQAYDTMGDNAQGFAARHPVLALMLLIWWVAICTFVILISFLAPPSIPGGTASALATVLGLFGAGGAVSLYRSRKSTSSAPRGDDGGYGYGPDDRGTLR